MIINQSIVNILRADGKDSFVKGRKVETSRIKISTTGSIQPDNNIKLLRESFGSNVSGGIKLYTEEKLRIEDKSGSSDYIDYDNDIYEIVSVKVYLKGLPHYKYTAIMRKDEN